MPACAAVFLQKEGNGYLPDSRPDSDQQWRAKGHLKTDQEYISIMFSDLYNVNIPNNTLNAISNVSESFGDKRVINELLLANALKDPGIQLPSKSFMRTYPDSFVTQTYRKFYTRDPNEFERYYFVNMIQKDTLITPELLYYTFGTSVEYRFY